MDTLPNVNPANRFPYFIVCSSANLFLREGTSLVLYVFSHSSTLYVNSCVENQCEVIVFLGAFIPGVAVQPVCIRYNYRHVSFSPLSCAAVYQ